MSTPKPTSGDAQLLRAAWTDPEAFGEFYRRHALAIERWIRGQTPDMATAADLTAETFAQALVGLGRFRGRSDESARAWRYGIARNLVRRYHRRGRVEVATCQRLGLQLDHDQSELDALESRLDAVSYEPELTRAIQMLPANPPGAAAARDRRDGLPTGRHPDGHQRAQRTDTCLTRP
jgi:RNA polymerase sigma-70 factor (ECF subfamily)